MWIFGRQIHALYGKIQASLAVLSAKAQENLAGVRVVRAYGQEEAEIRGFDAPNREYIDRNLRLIYFWSLFMPLLQMLIGLTFILVLWQGGRLVILNRITLGELIAFYTFMTRLIFPDDRAGIRDQHLSARRRFHGQAELHPRFRAEDQRRGGSRATSWRKSAAKSSSGT